jgi:hypothetical protein
LAPLASGNAYAWCRAPVIYAPYRLFGELERALSSVFCIIRTPPAAGLYPPLPTFPNLYRIPILSVALHAGAVRPHSGFVGNFAFMSPRTGHRSKVIEMLPAFSFSSLACASRTGGDASIFFSGPIGFPSGGVKIEDLPDGLALLKSYCSPSPW